MRVQNISPVNQKINRQSDLSFKRNWAEHVSWGANYVKQTGKTNFKLFSFPDAKAVFVEVANKMAGNFGKIRDRLVSVTSAIAGGMIISSIDEKSNIYPMENKGDGVFEAKDIDAKPNTDYRFVVVTKDNDISIVKDPYAKVQKNIHGWSTIYDKDKYEWKNTAWINGLSSSRIDRKTNEPLRGLDKLIIMEVNIPTLTKEGTFESAKAKIDEIAERKIANAIEIMPVENTFSKQWGYDGVDKFAVNENLGGADKLKELIDYAHGKDLNVIIDMVPNHMGTDGDYLAQTGPYEAGSTEFGAKLNYERKNDNRYVRDWMTNAALMWVNEFKADGLRLDLTKPQFTGSDYLLTQIALEVNEHNPNVFLIAEDHMGRRHAITGYAPGNEDTHEQELKYIDERVDDNSKGRRWTVPRDIGFDSEWDSDFQKTIKSALFEEDALDKIEMDIKATDYRVKYPYSHDEIGNEDGTRFIPKILVKTLNLYDAMDGFEPGNKGQRAAQASQKLAEFIVTTDFDKISPREIHEFEKSIGIQRFIGKDELINNFKSAFAKHKLGFGYVMTTPGPKMFFQGDEEADLSQFKFFRELSDDKEKRLADPHKNIELKFHEKGYDQLEEIARPDCIVGKTVPSGTFKDIKDQMLKFSQDLTELFHKHLVIQKGQIIATYKDHNYNVHIHRLKYGNDEVLVIKNFGQGFHFNDYDYYGFPQDSKWQEIFNSDEIEYGGSGLTNTDRTDITNLNQNLSLAPNSFIILRKI